MLRPQIGIDKNYTSYTEFETFDTKNFFCKTRLPEIGIRTADAIG